MKYHKNTLKRVLASTLALSTFQIVTATETPSINLDEQVFQSPVVLPVNPELNTELDLDEQVFQSPTTTQASPETDFFFEDGYIKKYLGVGGEVILPTTINGETVLGYEGFTGTDSITALTLPNTLTTLGSLEHCVNLTALYVPGDMDPSSFSMGMLKNIPNLTVYSSTSNIENYTTIGEFIANWDEIPFVSTGILSELPEYHSFHTSEYHVTDAPRAYQYSQWAESHVQLAREQDLIPNALGRYFYNDILRFQIAESLVQLVEVVTDTSLPTPEANFTDTALPSVRQATEIGLISGLGDGNFGVIDTATREQIAVMLVKTIQHLEEVTGKTLISSEIPELEFTDEEDISDWAKESVRLAVGIGLMSGMGDGSFSPKSNTTIEQTFVILNQIYQRVMA